ncbi:hypothetical protein GLYMA_18G160166v4 [Glycine max]|nr:hypothetical protein GLYMA_18G160166v4 [Glycine max]KAH1154750.1 hypothetical protein GYH30_050159 [Glycine max]
MFYHHLLLFSSILSIVETIFRTYKCLGNKCLQMYLVDGKFLGNIFF